MDIGGIIVLEYFSLPMFEKESSTLQETIPQFVVSVHVAVTIVSVPRFDRERKGCKEKPWWHLD
jgi:hypothetical protein